MATGSAGMGEADARPLRCLRLERIGAVLVRADGAAAARRGRHMNQQNSTRLIRKEVTSIVVEGQRIAGDPDQLVA